MQDCIFCKIIRGEIPCYKIYENEKVLCFADINPINTGHCLIIPKNHAENLWEISADDLSAVHRTSISIAKAMQSSLNAEGIAVLQLNGKSVNQLVMHYHLHLIPRCAGDPEIKLTQWEMVPGDMQAIEATAKQIAAAVT
jgi:histidine triad (HIT) family protein